MRLLALLALAAVVLPSAVRADYEPLQLPSGNTASSGQAGGPRDAASLFGGDCVGMIDNSADHVLTLSEPGEIVLDVRSSADTTLVLVGAGMQLCNDDRSGNDQNPLLRGTLPAGSYEVYIGAYDESDQLVRYTISAALGESAADSGSWTDVGTYGDVRYPGRFRANGQVGGPRDARAIFGGSCNGMIDNVRDHLLTVEAGGMVTVEVDTAVDATLVVTGPGGIFCNDDRGEGDKRPRVAAQLAPGAYEIYVGAYGDADQLGNYTLTVR